MTHPKHHTADRRGAGLVPPRDLGFGRLFESVRDAVIVADAHAGEIVLWNPAAAALFGYRPQEARGLPLEALVPERLRPRYRAELARYRETGHGRYIDGHAVLDLPARHQSGAEIAVELTLSPLADLADGRRYALAIVRDVTARKRIEEELRASAESFDSLFNATTEGIVIHDQGRHLAVNQTLAAMLGYEVAELLTMTALDVVTPESRALLLEKVRSGDEHPYEVAGLRKDGSTFPAEVAGRAIRYRGRPARLAVVRDISERKRLQEALLHASEARFVTVFQVSPVAMSISTLADGRFRDVNDSFLQLTGYRREEVIGHTAEELRLSVEPGGPDRLLEALGRQGIARNLEGAYRTKSGEVRASLVSAEIISVDGEECLLAITNDITARKRAEEALRESAESFDSLFNATSEGMVITERGRMARVNQTFARMLGYEVAALEGRSPLEITAPDCRELVRAHMLAGYERPYEADFLRRDGATVPLEIAGRPIRYQGRQVRLVTIRDIGERRRAEEALRASEQRFRSLVQNAADIIVIFDADDTLRYVSPAVERVLGYTPDELLGVNRFALLHPRDAAAVRRRDRRMPTRPGVHEPREFRVRHRDGSWHYLEGTATNLLDEPSVNGIVVNCRDVTERKRVEEERARLLVREQAARAQAEETARLREEFLSIASHELKTPLTSIKGNAQLLARQLSRPAPDQALLRRSLDRLGDQIGRLEALVEDLLDASRLQQGRLTLRRERLDLAALARQVLDRFAPSADQPARHALLLDAPRPVAGVWDADRLDQVLTNLVSNALKYSPQGGEVRVRVRRRGGLAEVAVSDQGIGIPREEQAALFQPFVRAAGADRIAAGEGLGLYITAKIVERHGGTIALHSEPGAGSTFTVRLPLAAPAS